MRRRRRGRPRCCNGAKIDGQTNRGEVRKSARKRENSMNVRNAEFQDSSSASSSDGGPRVSSIKSRRRIACDRSIDRFYACIARRCIRRDTQSRK